MPTNNNGLTQHRNCAGFTLIEVLIAVLIFSVGILSMAAFSALNYMYLRNNQANAKVHVQIESTMEEIQQWSRVPTTIPAPPIGPTKFDSIFNGSFINDTILTFSSGNLTSVVIYDSVFGASSAEGDARIFLTIISTKTVGDRTLTESTIFRLSNYAIGE